MAAPPVNEPLRVTGSLPPDLAGSYLQSSAHPVHGGPLVSGVRIVPGHACRYRAPASARLPMPLGFPMPLGPLVPSVARPVSDGSSGLWHTVAAYPGLDHAEHLVAGPDGAILCSRPFSLPGAPLMASIALTERFVVIPLLPVRHSRAAELLGLGFPYAADPCAPASIGLLPRHGPAEPRWFPLGSGRLPYAVNAYEEGGVVVLDVVLSVVPGDGAGPDSVAGLHRVVLCPATGNAMERTMADVGAVTRALVDDRVAGRRQRVVLTASRTVVTRHDLVSGDVRTWEADPGWRLGEPVFVPRARAAEGEGWLLVPAHHPASRRARLLVLDAAGLGAPCAAVHLPGPLPVSHRAAWLPADGSVGAGSAVPDAAPAAALVTASATIPTIATTTGPAAGFAAG